MAVFPESMNRLNAEDTAGSLKTLESYINYMTERVEFSMRNMTRNVSDAGTSSVEVLILLQEMAATVSQLASQVNAMNGQITTIGGELATVKGQITALDARVSTLENPEPETEGS